MSSKAKCKINSDGSVCLSDILCSFNASVKEEHAWALCYQIVRYYDDCLQSRKQNIFIINEQQHVYLKTDGNVHERTGSATEPPRRLLRNEKEIIVGIGVVIYSTLDCETQNEEKLLNQDLEQLISDMIIDELNVLDHSHHETDDEGIERDSEESEEPSTSSSRSHNITLQEVIRRCESHLGSLTKVQAEAHYKAVVRALVAEALELSFFLEKVAQGSISLPSSSTNSNLGQLQFSDWARFWVQVMNELRTGVKLKKVNFTKAPIEYELTPHEVLMKDIRNCKYNLRKIMVNGVLPSRVTKDAHAIILEFIRSRPPLKKVTDRKIIPQTRTLTPREQLLSSIKKGRKLRPVPIPRTSRSKIDGSKNPVKGPPTPPQPAARKLIKVDFSMFEDEDEEEPSGTPEPLEPGLWSSEFSEECDAALEAYDLATHTYTRNTLEVVDRPATGCYSVPQSRPGSRQSCTSSEAESVHLEPETARRLQDELTGARGWQQDVSLDDRLSLTLAEIVHIRSVLTKAELEALPVEGKVRHDVEARKVCFLCLKTRFGIFGPWGQRCALCKRTVCAKCCSRMRIPMEHFAGVPVVLLSPSIMCTPEEEEQAGAVGRAGGSMEGSVTSIAAIRGCWGSFAQTRF
ncbi:unnamed protein product [Phaedon cochleariae]|uniref:Uncharacterized protein n=1 Tax=Phaedon cochleariae TaxID=80249 RepID=A0A9P0GRD3_PHACE|nr:unnamed protein product [Phaedon cochleariae]